MYIMNTKNLCSIVMVAFLSLIAGSASAVLISKNDPLYGMGSLTVDSSTGLEWLDLSVTDGMSFNEVSGQLGFGGTYSGFRFATPEEIFALFVEAQIPDINQPGDFGHIGTQANAQSALALVQLMGPSYQVEVSGVLLSEIAGFSSQHASINGFDLIQMPYVTVREGVGGQSFGEVFTTGSWIFPSNPYEGVGSWLVRPVPEPSIILLMCAGLLLVFVRVRLNS